MYKPIACRTDRHLTENDSTNGMSSEKSIIGNGSDMLRKVDG